MSPAAVVTTMWRHIIGTLRQHISRLDDERVSTFQAMYYALFTAFAATLIFVPTMPAQEAATMLKPALYHVWLGVNLLCPPMTMLGRRLTTIAGGIAPGQPNPAAGAASLQFAGDLGVWGSVNLWVASMFQTDWWRYNLFVMFFMVMGVLGGFMFTARSARRLIQIHRKNRQAAKTGLPA